MKQLQSKAQNVPDGSLQTDIGPQEERLGAPDVALTFGATECCVRRALTTLRSGLRFLNLPDLTLDIVELVLAEATNNIVEHAYGNTAKGVIGMTVRARDGMLLFELSDSGMPMPGLTMPEKQQHDLAVELDDLPEGGFGWGLIRDMTMSLSYRHMSGRNILRFGISTSSH